MVESSFRLSTLNFQLSTYSARPLEELANQSHARPYPPAFTEFIHRFDHSPAPVRARGRSGNVESIFAREKVCDHNKCNPRFAAKKRFHDRRIEIGVVVCLGGWRD